MMFEIAVDYNFGVNPRKMATLMTEKSGAIVHKSTVQRAMQLEGWIVERQKTAPKLKDFHLQHRLNWCAARRAERREWSEKRMNVVEIHVDEKWFYAFRTGRWLYMPPGIEAPILECVSKTRIPKVMFIAAVANPIAEIDFDGRVLFLPIVEKKVYQNDAKFGKCGDEYSECTTMNGALFRKFLQQKIPAAVKKNSKIC